VQEEGLLVRVHGVGQVIRMPAQALTGTHDLFLPVFAIQGGVRELVGVGLDERRHVLPAHAHDDQHQKHGDHHPVADGRVQMQQLVAV